jgi:hypothetical protein
MGGVMSIVLQSTSGGSVTINEPTTASNFTQSLPAATGTVMVSGNMPAFSAYNSTATALTSNASTKILFQTEIFDTNNNFASSRFTPTVAGYYQINGTVRADYVTSLLTAAIWVNGAINISGNFTQPASTQVVSTCSGIVYLNGTTDYVEIYAFVAGAGNTTTGQAATCFNGALVRSA